MCSRELEPVRDLKSRLWSCSHVHSSASSGQGAKTEFGLAGGLLPALPCYRLIRISRGEVRHLNANSVRNIISGNNNCIPQRLV